MQNEVWSEVEAFLNGLRCGNVKRASYIQFSEWKETEKKKREAQKKFLKELDLMETGQRDCVQYYLETVKHLAFISEEQAYCQGYVDCVQLLAGLGMLRDFPDIKELVEEIQN